MNTCFIAPKNENLTTLVAQLIKVTGANIDLREVILITTENGSGEIMQKILEASGLQWHVLPEEKPAEQPAAPKPAVKFVPRAEPQLKPVQCPYCQESYTPHKKDQQCCGKPTCKAARKKAYMKEWHTRQEREEKPAGHTPFTAAAVQDMADQAARDTQ